MVVVGVVVRVKVGGTMRAGLAAVRVNQEVEPLSNPASSRTRPHKEERDDLLKAHSYLPL